MTEAEEVRFLRHILSVLRKHQLAPDLFPELKNRGETGAEAYYIAFHQNMPQIAEDIITEFFKYEDERRGDTDTEGLGGIIAT